MLRAAAASLGRPRRIGPTACGVTGNLRPQAVLHEHVRGRQSSGERTVAAIEHSGGLSLLRDFIHESLYHPGFGYFASRDVPVGRMPKPLDFRSLLGQDGYNYALAKAYSQLQVAWLTPSEIFRPYYGQALAQCMLTHHLSQSAGENQPLTPFVVYELGAGTGTVARNVLDFAKVHAPEVYQEMKYITVEISDSLAALQHQQVCEEGGHAGRFHVQRRDATNASDWDFSDEQCYVLALEVMDNMPHDRIVWQDGGWHETSIEHAVGRSDEGMKEVLRPLQDDLIMRCMQGFGLDRHKMPSEERKHGWLSTWLAPASDSSTTWFLPTKTLELFETLHRVRPRHHLITADFSELPDVQMKGMNAPLVSSTSHGTTTDYPTYMIPKGSADIFFPSDFKALSTLYSAACTATTPAASSVHDVTDFMYTFANWKATSTLSGYNPLLEDFTNTKILLGNMTGFDVRQRQ